MGDERLAAGDDVLVAVAPRGRPHAGCVGARARLGQRVGRDTSLRQRRAEREAHEFNTMSELAKGVSKLTCLVKVKTGDDGKMFGSVTSADIAEGLAAQGFKIDKRQAQLGEPLKTIGEFPVTIKVFRDVTAQIKVSVEKEA